MPRDSWRAPATPEATSELRREVVDYIAGMRDVPPELVSRLELALSEAVSNAAVHAYAGREPGEVRVAVHVDHRAAAVLVEVNDDGSGPDGSPDSHGSGYGLRLVRAAASSVELGPGQTGGTHLSMRFDLPRAPLASG